MWRLLIPALFISNVSLAAKILGGEPISISEPPFTQLDHQQSPTELWGLKTSGPYPTNIWWSNLVLGDGTNPVMSLPFSLKTLDDGLHASMPAKVWLRAPTLARGVDFCPHPAPSTFVLRWNFLITSLVLMSECYPSSFFIIHYSFTDICPHILKPHQVKMSSPQDVAEYFNNSLAYEVTIDARQIKP